MFGAEGLAAQHAGQQLAAEAETKHGHTGVDCRAQQQGLALDEGLGVVERRELGTEGRDEVVVARVIHPFVEVDPMDIDVRALRVKPFTEVPGRGWILVLENQGLEPSAHATGLASSLLSSSFATSCNVFA